MMGISIGIDPGLDGAIVVLDGDGRIREIHDMPTLQDGAKGRRALNAPLLAALIFSSHASRAYCELIGPRPTNGVVGAFGFGRSRGIIEGVLGAAGIPVEMLPPPTWKRHFGIAAGKENKDTARSVAISKWPAHATLFARKCDIDRAEAALIGLCGLLREGGR
jgi:crossover junction endodeoxyribonuclease RuvC